MAYIPSYPGSLVVCTYGTKPPSGAHSGIEILSLIAHEIMAARCPSFPPNKRKLIIEAAVFLSQTCITFLDSTPDEFNQVSIIMAPSTIPTSTSVVESAVIRAPLSHVWHYIKLQVRRRKFKDKKPFTGAVLTTDRTSPSSGPP